MHFFSIYLLIILRPLIEIISQNRDDPTVYGTHHDIDLNESGLVCVFINIENKSTRTFSFFIPISKIACALELVNRIFDSIGHLMILR